MGEYRKILQDIAGYQDQCICCEHYQRGECGFAFPTVRLSESEAQFFTMFKDENEDNNRIYRTCHLGEPCQNRLSSIAFLNGVENELDCISEVFDESEIRYLIRKIYRCETKYSDEEPFIQNTSIREDISKALGLLLAKIDYECLEQGISIRSLIRSANINYTREEGLYKICPKEIAIEMMRNSLIWSPDGFYVPKGAYDDSIEDVVPLISEKIGTNLVDARKAFEERHSHETVTDPEELERLNEREASIEDFMETVSGSYAINFMNAFALKFGFKPALTYLDEDGSKYFIENYLKVGDSFLYPWMKGVTKDLTKQISNRKHDETELTVYISGLLSRLDQINNILSPRDGSAASVRLCLVYELAYTYRMYSLDEFYELFSKACEEAEKKYKDSTEEYCTEIRHLMFDSYFDSEHYNSSDIILAEVSNLIASFSVFENALEAALLLNNIPNYYKYYEDLANVHLNGVITEFSIAAITELTPAVVVNFAKQLNHPILKEMLPGETVGQYFDRAVFDGNRLSLAEMKENCDAEMENSDDSDDYIPLEKRPKLKPGSLLSDIPYCNVEEVDELNLYYDDIKKYLKYYSVDAERAFRKKCFDKVEDPRLSHEEKRLWALRVLQALDTLYSISNGDKNGLAGHVAQLATILECAFMQMEDPICTKKIGIEHDLTCILRDSIVLRQAETDDDKIKQSERFYSLYYEIGGNYAYFEKRMCSACDLIKCPYRNHISAKVEDYVPEDFPEDILTARHKPTPAVLKKSKREESEEAILTYLDRICQTLPPSLIKCNQGSGKKWIFKGTVSQFAYIGIHIQSLYPSVYGFWKLLCSNVKLHGDGNDLKGAASRIRKNHVLPDGREDIDKAINSIK